jgi:O-methyltransferase involved in polyketide biosynthesis
MLDALDDQLALLDPEIAARVEARHADARTLRLGRRFERVIFPFNGLAHFHDADEQAAVLDTVKAHLAPGGLFAFDLMIPDPQLLAGGGASVPRLVHPRTHAVCRMEETYTYDAIRQVLTVTTRLIERETEAEQTLTLLLRQFFPQETLLLLEHHGFAVVSRTEELGDALAYICRLR